MRTLRCSNLEEGAHLVADNRLAELAEADETALRGLLAELKASDFDVDLAGFDATALEGLLAEPPAPVAPGTWKQILPAAVAADPTTETIPTGYLS